MPESVTHDFERERVVCARTCAGPAHSITPRQTNALMSKCLKHNDETPVAVVRLLFQNSYATIISRRRMRWRRWRRAVRISFSRCGRQTPGTRRPRFGGTCVYCVCPDRLFDLFTGIKTRSVIPHCT